MSRFNSGLLAASWFRNSLNMLLACAVFGWLVSLIPVDDVLNKNWVDVHIRNSGYNGMLVYVAIGACATALAAPRQLIAFLGGYAFGFGVGCVLSTVAVTFGCIISFTIARVLARPLVERRFAHKVRRVNLFLAQSPFTKTIIIRLLPVGNNLVTNLVAGVCQVKAVPFVSGSMLGYIPQMAIFALMGKGVVVLSVWKMLLSAVLFVISALLSVRLYKQYKASGITDEESSDSLLHSANSPANFK